MKIGIMLANDLFTMSQHRYNYLLLAPSNMYFMVITKKTMQIFTRYTAMIRYAF